MPRPSTRSLHPAPRHRAEGRRPARAAHATSGTHRSASHRTASHRTASHRASRPASWLRGLAGRAVLLPGLAVAATGLAVTAGLVGDAAPSASAVSLTAELDRPAATVSAEVLERLESQRDVSVSRSDRRTNVDPAKAGLLSQEAESGGQVTRTEDLGSGDPRAIARAMLPEFGFSSDQFSCLDSLWTKESGWNVHADNPSSSAYGIPQALPGSKMSTAGADWATNPATQIRWGLGYIASSYGSPCSAWSHSQSSNWY